MSARLGAPALAEATTPALRHFKPGGGVHPGVFRVRWTIGQPMAMLDREVPGGGPGGWHAVGEIEVVGGADLPVPAVLATVKKVRLIDPRAKIVSGPQPFRPVWNRPLLQVLGAALRKVLATPICRVCRGTLLAPCAIKAAWTEPCTWCVGGRARHVCDTCTEALPLCPCVARESITWQAVGDFSHLDQVERRVLRVCDAGDEHASFGDEEKAAARRLEVRGLLDATWNPTNRGRGAARVLDGP